MDTDIVSCNNDWALQRIVIFTSLCKCLDKSGYGKHFQLTVLMPSVHLLVLIHLELCPCCIPLLVVTPPLTSWAGERNPLGKLESRIVRLHMRSFILLITNITTGTRRTLTSSCLSVFNMVLYDKASNETSVNEARTLESIPPTQVTVIIRYF